MLRPGDVHDTGARLVLRRSCPGEERARRRSCSRSSRWGSSASCGWSSVTRSGSDPTRAVSSADSTSWFLRDVGAEVGPFDALTIPHSTYMIFQMMFAVITPALITGAFAERMKFRGYVLFMALWSILCYSPVAHWVWGGGWLGLGRGQRAALDFAGGTVVHINAGVAALARDPLHRQAQGIRQAGDAPAQHPHGRSRAPRSCGSAGSASTPESALTSGGLASSAFVATHLGAAAAILGWIIPEWIRTRPRRRWARRPVRSPA